MADKYNCPKPGDVIAKWNDPAETYVSTEKAGDTTEGDNPSGFATSIDIQKGQGDQRNFSGGPKGNDPAPAKAGA